MTPEQLEVAQKERHRLIDIIEAMIPDAVTDWWRGYQNAIITVVDRIKEEDE